MFQSFDSTTSPDTCAVRVQALRRAMKAIAVDGFLVPRADIHQGEYVPARDARLGWISSFTGSAGFAAVLDTRAALFVDGRYGIQARQQVDLDIYEIWKHPEQKLSEFILDGMAQGAKLAYDPWLHTIGAIEALRKELAGRVELVPVENLIDKVWQDQPPAPQGLMQVHPLEFAGLDHVQKIKDIAAALTSAGQDHMIMTQPDNVAWLTNTRGSDLGQTPVTLCLAVLHSDARLDLYIDEAKLTPAMHAHLGDRVSIHAIGAFARDVQRLAGVVRIDRAVAPQALADLPNAVFAPDAVTLAKARKNPSELQGARAAHLRDGAAMATFLYWVSQNGETGLNEIQIARKLEEFRTATGQLRNISFDTICGSGPNGAIVHYRVNEDSNRQLNSGEILLVDSGAQYQDGTTDITRTLAIGPPPAEAVRANTLVLQGMIAISRLRFPRGLAGRDIDAIARQALWNAGLDYDHGTGHGVGSFLSVHEGPQGISRRAEVELAEGMILSNEPGYYKEGAFGIRIENLVYVTQAPEITGADARDMLSFVTLTLAPIDRALIDVSLLTSVERHWLDTYHAQVLAQIAPLVSPEVHRWLTQACAPL
ncbi:Xaa-Pro aminopeptidase [Amylibacter marinus]|uniref:Xaa-Pro aminopeptidase n=1 Tax=Amylibacter marinus TaxID=1475483 RepID=A0ABQ5VUC8_9RHOB|nr:aminopeptidase P family protein [Amylibacter marinus]GLQ34856.1 Xaa-Pro aminopeptidase [Amylibacter marinus]